MTDEFSVLGGPTSSGDDLIEIDLNFESMRRFQGEFSPNLSKDGFFIDTGEPLSPGSVVRFRVILPEDFVFLEGTAVVEWQRGAEAVSDGPPGMALRFVTLSPQNQELVEQLVQDYVEAGGTPFDLDVRPEFTDFPTDALEGAPIDRESVAVEGYRLTVRGAGAGLEAEALQALMDAAPDRDEPAAASVDVRERPENETAVGGDLEADTAGVTDQTDRPQGFENVSESTDPVQAEVREEPDPEETSDEPSIPADVGDPPDIDWPVETEAPMEDPTEQPDNDVAAVDDGASEFGLSPIDDVVLEDEQQTAEEKVKDLENSATEVVSSRGEPSPETEDYDSSITDVLNVPEEFASGPEVIEDVEEAFSSSEFEVSLPGADDEPDTTPVMPDEGRGDVTVAPVDEGNAEPSRRRRLWPYGLAAVLVVAIAAGFLSPYAQTWLESRGQESQTTDVVAPIGDGVEQPKSEPVRISEEGAIEDSAVPENEAATAEDTVVSEDEVQMAAVESEPTSEVDAPATNPVDEAGPAIKADSIESIDVEAGVGQTTVRIRGNGNLEDGAVSMESLSSPPRVLVRLRGIRSVFRPYTIESATGEVTRARIGLHEDRRPPELWVVLDLARPQTQIGGIDIQGDRVEFVISGP